jgi:hypothetical protein
MSAPVLLRTRVGFARWEDHVLFGRSLFGEVANDGLAQLVVLLTSGRTLDPEDVALFEEIACCVCIVDPHVWPLKIARVGAAHGRFVPGLATGLLLFESDRVGPLTTSSAAQWLQALAVAADAESFDSACARVLAPMRAVAGFGVPFRDEDERLVELARRAEKTHHAQGRYHRVFVRACEWMRANRDIPPNVSALCAALLLDMGLAPDAIAAVMLFFCGLAQIPNAIEAAQQRAEVLRAVPEDAIAYEGPAPRRSPRAR